MLDAIIYLDNNATTRPDDRVVAAMLPFFTSAYANPASPHLFGLSVKETVDDAINQVASLINAKPTEIVFTSGATEAINMVLKGFPNQSRKHIVTTTAEHKAVLDTCESLDEYEVTYLEVDADGFVPMAAYREAVTDNTLLVCVMIANNETGVLNPIREMAEIAHESGALFFTDATQAVGKIPVDVKELTV
ncbi:MAG: aminotransferase class V-fold PLP-dependent enzyme, partial [Sphingobacteriales bacterium]